MFVLNHFIIKLDLKDNPIGPVMMVHFVFYISLNLDPVQTSQRDIV